MTSSHPFQRLLRYGRRYRRQVWLASLCSVFNKFFDLAPPVLIGLAVDVVVQQQDSWIASWGIASVRGQFLVLTALTIVTWGLESAFQYAYSVLWRNLAQTMQRDLRIEAYSHLQDMDLAYFEDHSTGGLMAVLNDDINQLERFLDVGANEVLQVITTIILVGGAFLFLAPSVAWMAIIPMPFIVWGAIAFQKLLAPAMPPSASGSAPLTAACRIIYPAFSPSKASPLRVTKLSASAKTAKLIGSAISGRSLLAPLTFP